MSKLWCVNQDDIAENGAIICLAHLVEGRVLNCPYKTKEEWKNAAFPCSDCKEKEGKTDG